jgi:four helix bundle protein
MSQKSYSELIAWQKAMDLAVSIYRQTERFPKEELYGLQSQMRRAGISIPSNVAEGQARWSRKPFLLHLSIAYGSLCELETQILLASRLGYFNNYQQNELLDRCSEVNRLLNGLAKSLKQP